MNKLIYIVNHYSQNQNSHFYHIPRLLEEIASLGVEIVLVIEKADGKPEFQNSNIRVITQNYANPLKRMVNLFLILKNLQKQGFKKIFVRISQNAALTALITTKLYGGEVYYWQSGTTHIVKKSHISCIKAVKEIIKSDFPFYLVKKWVDYFVTGPESMIDYYRDCVKVNKNKLLLLYNDVDLKRFFPISESEKKTIMNDLGLNYNDKIILFVHRLSPVRKTLYYMPFVIEQALGVLEKHGYTCIVIGDGQDKMALELSIQEKNLGHIVKVLGGRPNNIIQKYYQISDIFINPTYTEGFPRVLLEAMASGLPIITTNAGGISDLFDGKQLDYVVDINNREAFSNKLVELIKNNVLKRALSYENLNRVKRYSTESVAKMYIDEIFNNE